MNTIGKSVPRTDGLAKVKGEALFPGDYNFSNQLWIKVLFARRPHAIVKQVLTQAADALPGVVAVFTAMDVPVNEYGLGTRDEPVLCGPGSNKPYADHVRFVGDRVAFVVAETEAIAAMACDLIQVEYEDLPVIVDPREAMKESAPLVHPDRGTNIFCHYRIRKGDTEEAFRQADVIIEGDYKTPAQEHVFLQPESGVGYLDEEGRVTIVVAGQWVHEDQDQVAHALNLPDDRVRIIYPAIGGAFGGREDVSVQIILGLAVLKLHQRGIDRPVKIIWTREESILAHGKRHPFYIHARWGAKRDGRLVAAEVEMLADGGAYNYTSPKVLGNATLLSTGPYEIPNIKVDSYAVSTNHIPTAAFRGFGGPQGLFEAEQQMNKLAEALGMDPVEIRMKNILHEGSILSVATPLPPGVSMPDVLEKCAVMGGWKATEAGWVNSKRKGLRELDDDSCTYGIGVTCGFKNVGFSFGAPETCNATIKLYGKSEIEKAVLYHAGAEVGQGSHTVFKQFAAEALSIPIGKIELVVSDTALTDNSGSVSASRMTFMAGNAIKGAAEAALAKWNNEERPAVGSYQYRAPKTTPYDPQTGKSEPNITYGYVAEVVEVKVDWETGQVHVTNVICCDDVGKAINPMQLQGQIEGAVVQAMGYGLMENFLMKDGKVLTPNLSTYLIPTILDIPDQVKSEIMEFPDPRGPYGARGMGEMPYLSLVPAITAAVQDATGVWFDEFPLIPERVLAGLDRVKRPKRKN